MSCSTGSHLRNSLPHEIFHVLLELRNLRNFNPHIYIQSKIQLLNDYLRDSGLKSCVIGVSGGIDSALALGLLVEAKKQKNSPIQKIVGALLPMFIREGTTNQSEATSRGKEVLDAFSIEGVILDLSQSHLALKDSADRAF